LPVFSMGAISTGPQRLDDRPDDALEHANFGDFQVTREDIVAGDADGVLFMRKDMADEIFTRAETLRDAERRQADLMRNGVSLRSQVQFDAYLAAREKSRSLSFRDHLRGVGGAIEE